MDNFNLSSKNYNKASNYDVPMLFFSVHYSLFTPSLGRAVEGAKWDSHRIHLGFTWEVKFIFS